MIQWGYIRFSISVMHSIAGDETPMASLIHSPMRSMEIATGLGRDGRKSSLVKALISQMRE
jgi:hypothetical protein